MLKHHHINRSYVLLLVLALLFYAGCSGIRSSAGVQDYRTGSEGLRMQWLPSNNYDFYEGDGISILVELSNKGTHDIEQGQLFISGFDPYYVDFNLQPSSFFSLEGKDEFNPQGEFSEIYNIEATRPRVPQNRDSFAQSIRLTACYDYRTKATAQVCVDPDPNNRRVDQKVCQLGAFDYGSQGHPVVITGVEPRVSDGDIRFTIRFANAGGGVVYDEQVPYDKCNRGLDYNEFDRVNVRSVTLGGRALFCEPQNPIRITSGGGTIVCSCENCISPEQSAYQTVLEMDLSYGYKDQIQQDIVIYAD